MAKHAYTPDEVAEWRKEHGGIFYFNKDDTNFMVPKAYGFGRTYNWANPVSWIFAVMIVAFLVWALFFRGQ